MQVRVSCLFSIFFDHAATCSIDRSPSPLFNAVPACAQWKDGSNKVAVTLACQFLRDSAPILDSGNFSYGLALKRVGDANYFGLTIDPEIYLFVRLHSSLRNLISLDFAPTSG
jgi:hypothetical protein